MILASWQLLDLLNVENHKDNVCFPELSENPIVIRALATGDSMTSIPFRGSKLTQVLFLRRMTVRPLAIVYWRMWSGGGVFIQTKEKFVSLLKVGDGDSDDGVGFDIESSSHISYGVKLNGLGYGTLVRSFHCTTCSIPLYT